MIKQIPITVCAAAAFFVTGLFSRPVDLQLLQRDPGTGKCRAEFPAPSSTARLKVYADGQLAQTVTGITGGSLTAEINAGLVEYKFELTDGGSVLDTADRVVCGDTYLIYGQSNAEAAYGHKQYLYRNDFLRTFRGSWMTATPELHNIGVWGMHLARLILEKYDMPVCIINGAKGNTAVRHLVRDAVYDSASTFYNETTQWGNYYKRMQTWVEEAGFTSSIRALLWHQGERQVYSEDENPANYYDEFMVLREQLYEDYSGLEKLFLFQIRPGCGTGLGFNIVNENYRKLARDNRDVELMTVSSNDIAGCHYGEQNMPGYRIIAEHMFPLVDTSFYGAQYDYPPGAPNLLQAAWTSEAKDEIVMEFDMDMAWNGSLEFESGNPTHERNVAAAVKGSEIFPKYLKNIWSFDEDPIPSDQVVSGRSEGPYVYLELAGPSSYSKLAYPSGAMSGLWPGPYITGAYNNIGALGFYVDIKDELDVASGCMDPDYVEYNPLISVHDSAACLTKIVTGCMDSNYQEYDSTANISDSTQCITLGVKNFQAPPAVQWDRRGLQILGDGIHSIGMYHPSGKMAASFRAEGRTFHTWPKREPGLYLIRVETNSGRTSAFFKVVL